MRTREELALDSRVYVQQMVDACLKINWEDPKEYAWWLSQTYYYVRHATRVLAAAAVRCPFEEEYLHLKILDAINEEKSHELLAERDLRHLGLTPFQFPELPETSAYYQGLYYQIQNLGPASLLGYFMPLEGIAAIGAEKICGRIVSSHGKAAFSFMKVHCQLDDGHYHDGVKFLDDLKDHHLEPFFQGMNLSAELYIGMINAIIKKRDENFEPLQKEENRFSADQQI